jgi:hypothetical protein
MLAYALSTLTMNHREFLASHLKAESFQLEMKRPYKPDAHDQEPGALALRILDDLNMKGEHQVRVRRDNRVVIMRYGLVFHRRITFDRQDQILLVEKTPFQLLAFLERVHRRTGSGAISPWETLWGLIVDAVAVAIVVWFATGFWMFLQIKSTRIAGLLLLLTGSLIFAGFLWLS